MTKKCFDAQLRSTIRAEDEELQERFEKADAILLKGKGPSSLEKKAPSVVRDTFSMPPSDNELIDTLRKKALQVGWVATRSEIVRAGLHALDAASSQELIRVLSQLQKMQPGRKR